MTLDQLVERARQLAAGPRRILGIAGAPGAGKSTLAARIAAEVGPCALVVPMDGFHLADIELARLGRSERKGAPDTFDPLGYMAMLRRIREQPDETIYAPAYERDIDQPIAGSIPVGPGISLVITEGNYLLHEQEPWPRVRPLLDECWWMEMDGEPRRERLIERHVQFGKARPLAREWVEGSDERNAQAIRDGMHRADLVVPGDLSGLV